MPLEPAKTWIDEYRDYLLLVGDITTHYASFERVVDQTIWMLAGLDDRKGACITTHIMGIRTKFRILTALMHEVAANEAKIKQTNELLEKAMKTTHYRNKYVHSPMRLAIQDGRLIPMPEHTTVEGRLKTEMVPYDRQEMLKTAERCAELKLHAIQLKKELEMHIQAQQQSMMRSD